MLCEPADGHALYSWDWGWFCRCREKVGRQWSQTQKTATHESGRKQLRPLEPAAGVEPATF